MFKIKLKNYIWVKKLALFGFIVFLVMSSIFNYDASDDKAYLILPAFLTLACAWEMYYQYYRK